MKFFNIMNLHKSKAIAFLSTCSSYKMLFIKHSKYDSADEVIGLITCATGEGSI